MDTALPQKFSFILDRNLAKTNCTGNWVCTSCDTVVLGNYQRAPLQLMWKSILCNKFILLTLFSSRCKKRTLYCRRGDLDCERQPLSYSYNFLPLVSNMTMPASGQVDLFTMRGPLWSTASVQFSLDLESVRAPSGTQSASRSFFRLRRTSVNQAVISLVRQLEGPQEVQLALSMKLYHENVYSGSAVAKLLVIVSEYDF